MRVRTLIAIVLFMTLSVANAFAECEIADAKLEEAVLNNPHLRGAVNAQAVRDLRRLRDAALILRSYGRHEDCERLLGNIRELISGPSMGSLGDNDEDEAEKQMDAQTPKVRRGRRIGVRNLKGAKPLISIEELTPALRADEIMGAEVRSSDDKIVGEVRNVILGARDRREYAIVASGGFFTPGDASIVVPIRSLKVTQERASFFLPMSSEAVKRVPRMPDQDFNWLSDQKWRARNDALFQRP